MPYIHPFCACARAVHADRTACMLLLVWALTERLCHMYAHLCACARAVKDLVRLHACSGASEHWLIPYAICILFEPADAMFYWMCLLAIICSHQLPSSLRWFKFGLKFYLHPFSALANSKGSGETACMLRCVWALTDRICQLTSIWISVLSWAFVSNMNLLRGKLTYCAYEKKTNEPAHGKLVLITKKNNEDLDETVHLCMLISVIEYECDSTHTLRPDKPFQRNLSKNTVMWWLTIDIWLKNCW